MTVLDAAPPEGTVRDWLDSQAETGGAAIAYQFTDGTAPLSWCDTRDRARRRRRTTRPRAALKPLIDVICFGLHFWLQYLPLFISSNGY